MGHPSDLLGFRRAASAPHSDRRPGQPAQGDRWVPIRSLAPRHRARILAHLLALDEGDRYLRFGYAAADAQVSSYVDRIDFARDEVFGIFNRRLQLVAVAHLAYLPEGQAPTAEFGVSVLARTRGRRLGSRLFEHAVLHARNRGIEQLLIHALSENRAMLKIARNAGAQVQREGSEAQAMLKLPPVDFASRMGQLVEDGAAELDYRLKVQARLVDAWLGVLLGARNAASKREGVSGS